MAGRRVLIGHTYRVMSYRSFLSEHPDGIALRRSMDRERGEFHEYTPAEPKPKPVTDGRTLKADERWRKAERYVPRGEYSMKPTHAKELQALRPILLPADDKIYGPIPVAIVPQSLRWILDADTEFPYWDEGPSYNDRWLREWQRSIGTRWDY